MKYELIYLKSITDNIDKILSYMDTDLPSDVLYDAVMHNLILIGEGSSKIHNKTREKYSIIPWRRIIGFRNIVVHEYLGVNEDDVWTIVNNHLPELRKNIVKMIKDMEKDMENG